MKQNESCTTQQTINTVRNSKNAPYKHRTSTEQAPYMTVK